MYVPSKESIICAGGTAMSGAITATSLQINDVMATVGLILTILCSVCTLVTMIVNLLVRIKGWYEKAKKDGKIDDDEKEELKKIVSDDGSEIIKVVQDTIDKSKDRLN